MKKNRIACIAVAACMSVSGLNSVFAVQTGTPALRKTEETEKIMLDEITLPEGVEYSAVFEPEETTPESDSLTETQADEKERNEMEDADRQESETELVVSDSGETPELGVQEQENLLPVEPSDPESMQLYKDFSYYDPQWVPDEALFGVWDGSDWVPQDIEYGTKSGGKRTVEGPLLKYDLEKYADTMRPIEEAAKEGNYEKCKELLLEHYRQKFALLDPLTGSSSRKTEINAQTLFYNLAGYSNGTDVPIEFLEVTATPGWCSIDVTDSVTSIGADTSANKGLLAGLVALRKDGYRAVLDSKEGANPPYLEVELSDGSKKTYVAQFDSSMSPAENASVAYGKEATLEIEESVSSIGSANNVDKNTSRVYVRFDMNDLSPQDEVRSAALYLYGSTNAQDLTYKKQIAVYKLGYDNTQNEANFNWNSVQHYVMSDDGEYTFDHLDTKYVDGKFFDTVYRSAARASGAIGDCISRYLATNNEEYAFHALRTLIGLCMERGMLGNPDDTGTYWPYSSKLCLGNRGQIYQNRLRGLIDSKYMTPDVFTCLLKLAWTTSEQLEYCWQENQETTSNWGNTQATALFNMSLYFDEFEDCHKPLDDFAFQPGSSGKSGGWSELATYRLILKSGEILFSDGSCTEVPMGYADYALNGFVSAYNMAVTANMEDEFPQEILDSMETLIEYLIFMSAPDGSGYSQGNSDDHHSTAALTRAKWLKDKTDSPIIKWYASERKEGTPPEETSKIYPVGLKYISRGGWGTNTVGSHFNADGGCNVHGHADDLSFDLFAYGEHLLVDNGVVDYNNRSERAWQISTRGHNTIEINGVGQKTPKWSLGSVFDDPFGGNKLYLPDYTEHETDSRGYKMDPGYFMDAELNSGYDYVRGGTNNYKDRKIEAQNLSWNDYLYERSVYFVRPDFYLITDYIDPLTDDTEVNTYEQRWHTLPGADISIDENTGTATVKGENASVIIAPVQQKDTVTVSLDPGYYTSATNYIAETQNPMYTKKTAGTTTMNTVIYPVAPGKHFEVTTQNIALTVPESTASAFSAEIVDKDLNNTETVTKYEKHVERDTQVQQSFGDYSTNGYLAVVDERNGELYSASLQGGTVLQDREENKLILSENTVEGLSVVWKNSLLELSTGKTVVNSKTDIDTETEIDMDKLTVYAPEYIEKVTLNGKEISFKRAGSYIYFGADPLLSDGEEPEKDDDPANSSDNSGNHIDSDHGSHSGGGSGSGGGNGTGGASNNGGGTAPAPSEEPGGSQSDDLYLYQELDGHWAQQEISDLIEEGIVRGDDGSLNLSAQVTRAEFAAMLIRALHLEEQPYQGGMQDVAADDWYAGVIQTCMEQGILQGSDGMMRPNDPVTREEMAKMLVAVYEKQSGQTAEESMEPFSDEETVSGWAQKYVRQAISLGLMNGFEDGTFRPQEYALREQAMVVIYRLLYLE